MSSYELTVVYSLAGASDKEPKALGNLEKLLEKVSGTVVTKNDWGKRTLAYPINKQTEAYFAHWLVELPSEGPSVMMQGLRVDEEVLRHLLVKTKGKKSTEGKKGTGGMEGKKVKKSKESTVGKRSIKSKPSKKTTKKKVKSK